MLTLRVISQHGDMLGEAAACSFSERGGSIGRSAGNDWALPDPDRVISGTHARITCAGGAYYLEDTSTNGVYLNDAPNPIGRGQSVQVSHGDRIFIGDYEIAVSVEAAAAAASWGAPVAPGLDPLQTSPTSPTDFTDDDALDPLEALDSAGASEQWQPAPPPPVPRDDVAADQQFFEPPRASTSAIPENWDDTSYSADAPPAPAPPAPAPPQQPPPVASAEPAGGAGVLPEDWDKTSFSDTPAAPPPQPAAPDSGASLLPEDWDKTSFAATEATPGPPPAVPTPPPAAVPDVAPTAEPAPPPASVEPPLPPADNWWDSPADPGPETAPPPVDPVVAPAPTPAAAPGVVPPSPPPDSSGVMPPLATPDVVPSQPAAPATAPPPVPPGPPPAPPPPRMDPAAQPPVDVPPAVPPGFGGPAAAPPAAAMMPDAGSDSVAVLLTAAGLPASDMPPGGQAEIADVAGQIFREVVAGLMEVLSARAALKSEFRIALTTIRPTQNNPLKFSPSVDEALRQLLLVRSTGYLPPVDAVKEGFDDIRAHQMAMMAGMKAAFWTLLERFAPDSLEEGFDKTLKRGVLAMNRKARYWDMFRDLYEELSGDPDEAFRRLFGEEFVRAYEEQMQAYEKAREI